jgi:hypothetical protein
MKKKKPNVTKPTQVRLTTAELAKLDAVDRHLQKEHGGGPNRSGAIRFCINKAYQWLFPAQGK